MPDHASKSTTRMAVVPGIDALATAGDRLFVVVGVFDGLHLGHLYLLGRLGEEAARRGAVPTVVTFDHHPDEILTGAAPALLCDPDERLERLEAAGVGVTIVQHFDLALRMTSYDAFVRRISDRVQLAGFLMTPDSAFGHERHGTPEAVAALGAELGYDVAVIPSLELDGRPVRSAEIRADIASGDLGGAARLLGRPYAVVGEGSPTARGRVRLSFPMPVALPPAGEYAVSTRVVAHSPGGAVGEATAVIDDGGGVHLAGSGVTARPRLRVTFGGASEFE
jgi:riboflavin kinase/FMN adenylyltransferase